MNAVVTGAGGFIGANLVRTLLARGHTPVAFVRPGAPPWRLRDVASELEIVPIDLRDTERTITEITRRASDTLFHLASSGAYSWQQDLDTMLAVNVRCLDALLTAARQASARLVNAGSSSEYGLSDHPSAESDRLEPNSCYAVTKAAATHLCRLAAASHGQVAITLRLYSIYGPWEDPRRLMPVMVRDALAGTWPPLVSPDTARDFVWVDDACDALIAAAELDLPDPGTILNVASGTQTTVRMLVELARDLFDVAAEVRWGEFAARSWDSTTWVGDPSLSREVLGWQARTPVRDGLKQMATWLDQHPELAARYAEVTPA
jgi:UDP-glucose 4-epimerase